MQLYGAVINLLIFNPLVVVDCTVINNYLFKLKNTSLHCSSRNTIFNFNFIHLEYNKICNMRTSVMDAPSQK